MNWLAAILAEIIRAIWHDAITTPGKLTEVSDATKKAPLDHPLPSVDDLLDVYGGMRTDG